MAEQMTLEARVAKLEQTVAALQQKLAATNVTAPDWIERISRAVSDESALLEALEYGRAWRQADRPADDPAEGP